MKKQAYRHGEILLLKIDKLPEGLKESKSKIIMTGSHGNNHEIDNGKLYFKQNGFTFGYLVAKNTNLLHLKYLNCFCPSTKREYFIGTKYDTCLEAKSQSFGLSADDIEWVKEW